MLSRVRLIASPRNVAHQAPPWDFPRQEYWSGLPFPPSGDLSDPGIKSVSPSLAGGFPTTEPPGQPLDCFLAHSRNVQLTSADVIRLALLFHMCDKEINELEVN